MRAAGEFAVKLGCECQTTGHAQFSTRRDEAEVTRWRRAANDEACARQGLKDSGEPGIADPVVRPGKFGTERQKRGGIERNSVVEAAAEFAPSVGRGAAGIGYAEAAAARIALAVGGCDKGLRLQRRIRCDGNNR